MSAIGIPIQFRPANSSDCDLIMELVRDLGEYEKLLSEVVSKPSDFRRCLFGETKFAEVIIAEKASGEPVGFALFFLRFSSFGAYRALYLEDLFIKPQFRGDGVGKSLLQNLARLCVDRGWKGMQWWVLKWNAPAINFYDRLGAKGLDELVTYRIAGDALTKLQNNEAASMSQAISIRTAQKSDIQNVVEYTRMLADETSRLHMFKGTIESYTGIFCNDGDPCATALLAETKDGQVVGLLSYCYSFSTFLGQPGVYVGTLIVHKDHRGKGVGTALVRKVAERTRVIDGGRIEARVIKSDSDAVSFYLRHGAIPMNEWLTYQLSNEGIENLCSP